MFFLKKTAAVIGTALLASAVSMSAQADTLRFAVGFPSGAPIEAAKKYAEAVKEYTDNRHKVKVYELSLLNLSEMSEGVTKGLADVGYVLTAYSPSDYPYSNLGADMSMSVALSDKALGKEGIAYAGAMLEYIMLNCDECQNEFTKNNQVYTGVVATPSYVMFCNEPTNSVEDLKGKRLRTSGAPWARWAKAFDAQPVSIPIGEIYEALGQGVVDCTFLSPTELTNFNLIEVVKNVVTDVPNGLYAAGGSSTLNKSRWDKFSKEDKEAMLKSGAVMTAYVTYLYQQQALEDLEKAKAKGINVGIAQPELLEKSREFIREDLTFVPTFYANEYKLDPARLNELSGTMAGLITKWEDIIDNANIESADDLIDLYWDEVYSKIDVETYAKQ